MTRFSPLVAVRDPFCRRVFLYLVVPMLLISVGFSAAELWGLQNRMTREFVAQGRAQTELLAHAARLPLFAGDRERLQELARGLLGHGAYRSVRVLDSQHRLLAQVDGEGGAPLPAFWSHAEGGPGPLVEHPGFLELWVAVDGRQGYRDAEDLYFTPGESAAAAPPLGYLGVLTSREPVRAAVAANIRDHVTLSLAFLAAAGFVALAVAAEATRPLHHLVARVAGEEAAGDGVAQLSIHFETLVAKLDTAFATIRELNAVLEQRVAERTGELTAANDQLQRAHDYLEERVEARTAELQQVHDQLRHAEKLTAIGRLASSLAHEFNNPLCGVRNCIAELRHDLPPIGELREIADLALGECDRMAKLVGSLRQFSRPSLERREPVALPPLLDAMLRLTRKQFDGAGIRVVTEYAPWLPPVIASADQLKQVFLNLLQNACDAMDDTKGTVTLGASRVGAEIRVVVTDQGTGIPPEHLDQIFEPFFSTKDAVKGTGLGLSVSHGIVAHLGGRIEVETALGRGSTFSVYLPAMEELI